jgi:hypothetical protein
MEAKALFRRELAALKSIDDYFVDTDYWQDETIRLYRGLGLVWTDGQRINLTEAGMQAIGRTLPAAQRSPATPSTGPARSARTPASWRSAKRAMAAALHSRDAADEERAVEEARRLCRLLAELRPILERGG